MADEETKALNYIPETILKKRRSNEDWALRRKQQLEDRVRRSKEDKSFTFVRAEQFIMESRQKELDLIRMKQRIKKKRKRGSETLGSKLLFIIRIRGKNDLHPKTRKVLKALGLWRLNTGVFAKANEGLIEMLRKVEPHVTYGYPNLKSVKELIYKKGIARIDKQRVPLTDNNIIEQALGKIGIVCIEDIVHEIADVGPNFKEVSKFLWPFKLNKPEEGFQGLRKVFSDGGESGNREDLINDLIAKMN